MSLQRQARLDAVVVLHEAGWGPERIALALGVQRATVERLTGWAAPAPKPAPPPLLGPCCHQVGDRYCDAPVAGPGLVYCAAHAAHGYAAAWPT
jgi:hypothetical protein